MRRRIARGARESDASAMRWTRIVFWAILLGCAAVFLYYLSTALWRIFGLIYRTYNKAAMIWPLP